MSTATADGPARLLRPPGFSVYPFNGHEGGEAAPDQARVAFLDKELHRILSRCSASSRAVIVGAVVLLESHAWAGNCRQMYTLPSR